MAAFFLCMFILFKNTKHKFIIHTYNIHMHPYTHKPHTKCTLLQCIRLHTNPAILRKYVRFMCIYIYKPVSQHSGFDTFSFSLILDAISRTMSRVYCITHRPDKYNWPQVWALHGVSSFPHPEADDNIQDNVCSKESATKPYHRCVFSLLKEARGLRLEYAFSFHRNQVQLSV